MKTNLFFKPLLLSLPFLAMTSYADPQYSVSYAPATPAVGSPISVTVSYSASGSATTVAGTSFGLEVTDNNAGVDPAINSVNCTANALANVDTPSPRCQNNNWTGGSGEVVAVANLSGNGLAIGDGTVLTFTLDTSGMSAGDVIDLKFNPADTLHSDDLGNPIADNKTLDAQIALAAAPPVQHALTATTGGNGSISCTPPAGNVAAGVSVTCNATPAAGYVVDTWTAPGACAGNACTFNMPAADTAVNVTFKAAPPVQYALTATAGANGSISCNPPAGNVMSSTSVTCNAAPAVGYMVDTWTAPNACFGNACTFIMPASDTTVNVTFKAVTASPTARQIPTVGLFGMLAMLASLFGAATVVLRRKQS